VSIDGELVLPDDVQLVPVGELPPEVRARLDAADGDVAVTRERSRLASSLVDRDGAELLASFRKPMRIVDAVLAFAGRRGLDPESTLERAYPVLSRLYRGRLLVPAGSDAARVIRGGLHPGAQVQGFRLIRCVQVLDDNEVFVARDDAGRYAALKFYRSAGPEVRRLLEQEAAAHGRVGPRLAPRVHGLVELDAGLALITEWVLGNDALQAADLLRAAAQPAEHALLGLCARVAAAFAGVHAAGLLHGDVHPRNVLVEGDGTVRLIDFGQARPIDLPGEQEPRGGVAFYFDPRFAQAQRRGQPAAPSSADEQYAVGALLYQMWTGVHYLDWSLERDEMLRQIVEDDPVSFEARRVAAWPELERVLRRSLDKRGERRFDGLRALSDALAALLPEAERRDRRAAAVRGDRAAERELLDRTLDRYRLRRPLLRDGLQEAPRASVNYGAGGIAYALLRVARRRSDGAFLALADLWIQKACAIAQRDDAFYNAELDIGPGTVGERSLFHSMAGLHCIRALVSAAQWDGATAGAAIRAFVEDSRGPNRAPGRAGQLDAVVGAGSLLLGCAELLETVPDRPEFGLASVRERGQQLAQAVAGFLAGGPIESTDAMPSLGLAHGWAGLAFVLLRWARATQGRPHPAVIARLDELAALAEPFGAGLRWPVMLGGASYMEGWCNGSAGHAMLYALAHEVCGEARYGELAQRAAEHAWMSGLSLGTLCCGQAGIGYALLAVRRITGSDRWTRRARACARRAAADRSGHLLPDALYKGAVGAALLAEELDSPAQAAMPLFEPIR
jgi:eukaryotic-like serine/threonine-protein kinase